MMKRKTLSKIGLCAVAGVMSAASVFAFAGCEPAEPENTEPQTYSVDFATQIAETNNSWTKETAKIGSTQYYVIKNVVYCETPTHAAQQAMNIYVPTAYLNADGSVNKTGEVNGYTAETAPIIFINNVSGYSGGKPWEITTAMRTAGGNNGWFYNYLERGFVLIFTGERGISTYSQEEDGAHVLGVAPISLVDLKAGIRFLRHNADVLPGDTDKIISNGVSAGGNCSALLGVTGDSDIFDDYLKAIGAVMDESDAIFASQDYCPITDLDHATLAYEWFWQGDYEEDSAEEAVGTLMAKAYATYFNGLELEDENGNALTLETDGSRSGTFHDWMVKQFEEAYNAYVELNGDKDSSKYSWLTYDEEDGASITSIEDLVSVKYTGDDGKETSYMARQKNLWSFDPYDFNSNGDCGVFGVPGAKTGTSDAQRHFTPAIPGIIKELENLGFTDYSQYYNSYLNDTTNEEVLKMINYYSPFHYVTDGDTTVCDHFRICVGTQDRDTSTTISATLALFLMNNGYDVEYNLMWNQIHTDADVKDAFENWVDSICKAAE